MFFRRKTIFDAAQHGDFTAEKFKEIQRRIESNIQNVNPAEEYRDFTEKHKYSQCVSSAAKYDPLICPKSCMHRTSPTTPIVFQFDQTLLEDKDTLGNKLQPNLLTVDNLTVDWLRSRLNDLENSVKECQEKQTRMITDNGTTVTPSSPILNGINGLGKDATKYAQSPLFLNY